MSMCNMSIEGGARAGMIAPDETTFAYLRNRPLAPKGELWNRAEAYWRTLKSDEGAKFDIEVNVRAEDIAPTVTWGTSPQDVVPITGKVPDPSTISDPSRRAAVERALEYMGLEPNTPWRRSRSTKSSSGPVPTLALKTSVPPPGLSSRRAREHVFQKDSTLWLFPDRV